MSRNLMSNWDGFETLPRSQSHRHYFESPNWFPAGSLLAMMLEKSFYHDLLRNISRWLDKKVLSKQGELQSAQGSGDV